MRGLICVLGAAGMLAGAGEEYFPLNVGNQWIYRPKGFAAAEPVKLEVTRVSEAGGRQYAVVEGWFGGALWLRYGDGGTLYRYLPAEQREAVYAEFDKPEGFAYETSVDPCNRRAVTGSRSYRYTGPIGEFGNALRIDYPPSGCADAGLTSDVFLPWVGLVERTETTIGGPRLWQLVYSKLGGIVEVAEPNLSFSLTLDRHTYTHGASAPAEMLARLTLRNTYDSPVSITFPSGQTYDIVVRNEQGEVVYQWSRGKAFTLALRGWRFTGEANYAVKIVLAGENRAPLPAGKYVAEAWLTTMGQRAFSASAGLEIGR